MANADYNELHPMQDRRNYDWPEGFGAIFVEFDTVQEAVQARQGIHMLKYGQDTKKTKADYVMCSYITETQFRTNQFSRELVFKTSELCLLFVEIVPATAGFD